MHSVDTATGGVEVVAVGVGFVGYDAAAVVCVIGVAVCVAEGNAGLGTGRVDVAAGTGVESYAV